MLECTVNGEKRVAVFSKCHLYRYTLTIRWDDPLFPVDPAVGFVQFIGLNPSTATHEADDPTLRRVKAFAKQWGFTGVVMTNLFAFRATLPKDMRAQTYPVGAFNDENLVVVNKQCALTIAAWGVHGTHLGRDSYITSLIKGMKCLRKTAAGHPEHPLYMPGDTKPIDFN